jgi:hypothetical protein
MHALKWCHLQGCMKGSVVPPLSYGQLRIPFLWLLELHAFKVILQALVNPF